MNQMNRSSLNDDRWIRILLRIAGILIVIHLANLVIGGPSWQFERLFSLGLEANIPTWFSSLLWFLSAFTAFRCFEFVKTKGQKIQWSLIASLFLAFSIDEVSMIHEVIFEDINRFFPSDLRHYIISKFKASDWPIIAAPFLIFTVIWLISSFRNLLKGSKTAQKFLLFGFAAVICGGYGLEITTNFLNHDNLQWVWELENVFEESLEIIGAILIFSGLLKHTVWLDRQFMISGHVRTVHRRPSLVSRV